MLIDKNNWTHLSPVDNLWAGKKFGRILSLAGEVLANKIINSTIVEKIFLQSLASNRISLILVPLFPASSVRRRSPRKGVSLIVLLLLIFI